MKITPIEIRQHTFEKGLRGYRPEDVDAFLVSLSQEWDRLTGEYKMLKMQLELAEKDLGKLKEVEMTLFRTLKTAEDTSAQITDQANKAADQYLAEARQKADELLADARKRSALMVQDAENQSRYLKDNILNDLKAMEHDFKALENYKESLAVQIRTIASNAVESIERFEKKFARQNLKGKIEDVTAQITSQSQQENPAPAQSVAAVQPVADTPVPVSDEAADESPTAGQQAVAAETPATDLPPLMVRETFIPEAIPADAISVESPADATHQNQQPEPAVEVDAHAPLAESSADDSSYEQVSTERYAASGEPSAPVTTEPAEPAPVKKSGSFFDQI